MSKIGWFGSDEDGNVVSKTEIKSDGTVHKYDYTKPDDIQAGHGHVKWNNVSSYLNDNENPDKNIRDKNDSRSINRRWRGNGYDLGIYDLESLSLLQLKTLKETIQNEYMHSLDEIMIASINIKTKKLF